MICEDKEPVALVLGGAGFIGKALCKALAVNYKVICVDNLVYGQYAPQGISFVHVDLSKSEEVHQLIHAYKDANIQVIYNLAATVGVHNVYRDPQECNNNNLHIITNSLDIMKAWPLARFIYTSTSEVYGSSENCVETSNLCLPDPTTKRGTYAATKLAGEYCVACNSNNYIICRPFNITGYGQPSYHKMVIPSFIDYAMRGQPIPIYGGGSQTRSFCSLPQCVYALVEFAKLEATNLVVNIGSPNKSCQVSIAELAHAVVDYAKAFNRYPQIVMTSHPYGDNASSLEIHQRIVNTDYLCELLPDFESKFKTFDLNYILKDVHDYWQSCNES